MPVTVGVSLKEDGARHILGGVGGDGKGFGEVGKVEALVAMAKGLAKLRR